MRPTHKHIAYLKASKPRAFHLYQPFRRTYGTAVWRATPIKPRWGFMADVCQQRPGIRRQVAVFGNLVAVIVLPTFDSSVADLRQ